MRARIFVPAFLLFVLLPSVAPAAPHLLWGTPAWDPVTGALIRTNVIDIAEGADVAVSFNASKSVWVEYRANRAGIGQLYFVPPNGPREFITTISSAVGDPGGVSKLAWTREGSYELDVYNPSIIIETRSNASRLFAWLFGERARAQSIGRYVGTIHFTIRNSLPQTTSPPNILFIPGMKGSRLYQDVAGATNRRWEPDLFESDIPALFLNSLGQSINTIFTNASSTIARTDVLLFNFDVYRTFFEKLDSLKSEGVISSWVSFPYDWRHNPEDIANSGTLYTDGMHLLQAEVERLAQDGSKVILVGHSNGGLVAKALVSKLVADGKAGLVSKVILIATPQLGTPDALAAMLHGEGQSIPTWGGFVVSTSEARGLAENMSSAYTLLPSSAYFSKVADPVVDLTKAPKLRSNAGISSTTISSATELENFLTGVGGRAKPAPSNTGVPNVLSTTLLKNASGTHDRLDTWVPPAGIEVIQIAGWGVHTPKAITYIEKQANLCSFVSCAFETLLTYDTPPTEDGDGTVVSPSAAANETLPSFFINMYQYNFEGEKNNKHKDITEITDLQILFQKLIASSSPSSLPVHVTTSLPTSTNQHLRLAVHSPVSIDAYDTAGNHTGLAPNQFADPVYTFTDEEIPNSYYWQYGHDKYIGIPGDTTAKVVLNGLANGTFTLEQTLYRGDVVVRQTTYADIPITASTTATLTISGSASSYPLALDLDGNGITDFTLSTSQGTDARTYLRLIIASIKTLPLAPSLKNTLTTRFTALTKLMAPSNNTQFKKVLNAQLAHIQAFISQQLTVSYRSPYKDTKASLTDTQATMLFAMITQLKTLIQ